MEKEKTNPTENQETDIIEEKVEAEAVEDPVEADTGEEPVEAETGAEEAETEQAETDAVEEAEDPETADGKTEDQETAEAETDAVEEAEESEDAEVEVVTEESAGTLIGSKRKKRKHRKKNRFLRALIVILVLAAAVVVINLPYFDVENISVIGNDRVEDAEVRRLSEMEDGKSLIGLNSFLAPHKIGLDPYMKDVKIKRRFPSTIEIIVEEKVPAGQLATPKEEGKTRKYVAIDSEGTVLEISEEKMDMTYIKDVDVTNAKLKKKVEVKQKDAYDKAMDIIATAAANDMFFMRITMSGSMVDSCIYGDLYCKGRYDNIKTALESGTLRTVVYRLYQQNVKKGTINVGDNDYCSFTSKT